MEIFLNILVLLSLIGLSNILNRFIPSVPVPLIQIALGAAISLLPWGVHMEFEPELFLVLFIAPLLFNDGKRTPRDELWNLRAPILLLALGLVFVTVLVAGYGIHWMIPTIPLAAAFALAAILSPTDAVAVGSLAGRVHLPKHIHRVLEGEALMNDASGLVAFKFAVAAAVTGVFSLPKASLSFVLIAAGGLLCGALLSFLIIRLSVWIRRLGMEDVTVQILIQILTPFVVYFVSEEIGVSGILAVVAAGVIHAIEKDRAVSPDYKLQIVSASTWSMLLFVLNGMVFTLLGVSIPEVIDVIYRDTAFDNLTVFGYVVIITLLLIVLRFGWIYSYNLVSYWRKKSGKPEWKPVLLTSISGVRGAVTLAGAFSIPLVLADGSPFPERDLIIFLAAGVILLSLLIASIFLPLLAGKKEEAVDDTDYTEQQAKAKIVSLGMRMLQNPEMDLTNIQALAGELRPSSAAELDSTLTPEQIFSLRLHKQFAEVKLTGIEGERQTLERLHEDEEISPELYTLMENRLSHMEVLLCNRLNSQVKLSLSELKQLFSRMFSAEHLAKPVDRSFLPAGKILAKRAMILAAIQAIQNNMDDKNHVVSQIVISNYNYLLQKLDKHGDGVQEETLLEDERQLENKNLAILKQREAVQAWYEKGEINRKTASRLRQFVDELEDSIWEM